MTTTEIAVLAGGGLLGYWIVSSMLGAKSNKGNRQKDSSAGGADAKRVDESLAQINHGGDAIASNWFRILEVPEDAGKDEIVKAYQKKISQYHPDKVAALGAELRDLAEEKSKQINVAYDYAVKLRGQA